MSSRSFYTLSFKHDHEKIERQTFNNFNNRGLIKKREKPLFVACSFISYFFFCAL